MNEFSEQLILSVVDKLIIGFLLAVAGYWFGRLLEKYRLEQSKVLEQFRTEQHKILEQLRGEQALRKEYEALRDQATMSHLQHQIEDLYGPLYGLIEYGKSVNEIEHQTIALTPDGQDTGAILRYFVEEYYLPINSQMSDLIRSKIYLLDTDEFPDSFRQFLTHAAQFECLHGLWKDLTIKSDHIAGIEYPKMFRGDAETTLDKLRREYNEYVSRIKAKT